MPGFDGTGPRGMGPMTGGGRGFCVGYAVPGYTNSIPGRGRGAGFGRGWGMGRGFGRGRGFGWRRGGMRGYPYEAQNMNPYSGVYYDAPYGNPYVQQITPKQEADMLKEQVKAMQEEIHAINEQIGALEKTAVEEKK